MVSGPSKRERARRARELERRMRELDELDRRHGLGAMPPAARPAARPPAARRPARGARTGHRARTVAAILATTVLAGALLMFTPGGQFDGLRRLVGLGDDRLSAAPTVPDGDGAYAFLLEVGGRPVGYDPCKPIRYQVNTEGAPSDWRELVDTAIAHTEQATGLVFEDAGTTDDRDFFDRRTALLDRAKPVLIGWADAVEESELSGDVAGLGGSTTGTPSGLGRTHFVTGSVLLDRDAFAAGAGDPARDAVRQAIIDHEFGHLVGLDHVQDPGELMNPQVATTSYGPGDLEGLARLGNVSCG